MNIPSTVIIQQQRDEVLGALRLDIQRLQNAINALKSIADFDVPTSADPAAWQDALDQATERREAARRAINDNPAFTCEQKAESTKAWRSWHFVIAKHVGSIIKSLTAWPTAQWRWDVQSQNLVTGRPTADIADEMATRPVPPEAQQHGELIGRVYDSIRNLRRWEANHGVRKLPIEALLKTPVESLAEQWCIGSVMRQTVLDTTSMARIRVFESTFI